MFTHLSTLPSRTRCNSLYGAMATMGEACTDSEFILCVPDDLWYFLLIEMSELDACIVF